MRMIEFLAQMETADLADVIGEGANVDVFDFVQPLAAGRQFIGFGWEARRDEPGREGKLRTIAAHLNLFYLHLFYLRGSREQNMISFP